MWIGTGKAAAVDQAQVCIVRKSKPERGTRQHFHIGTVELTGSSKEIAVRVGDRGSSIKIGPLKADTSHQADFSKIDGIHQIARTNFLNQVELARNVVLLRVIGRISEVVGNKCVVNVGETGVGPQFVCCVVVIVIY